MSNIGKTILILGNGFDLAHGLPTTYSHFLEFCQQINTIQTPSNGIIKITSNSKKIHEIPATTEDLLALSNLLKNNVWYLYFKELYDKKLMRGENWIDFESEIRYIIKTIDENSVSLTMPWNDVINKIIVNYPLELNLNIFDDKFHSAKDQIINKSTPNQVTVKDFREMTFNDLERLTRALEIYLTFVEKIPISDKLPKLAFMSPDYVISFNYTDTYERIYKRGDVYHIHGKAVANRSIEDNNMVLGIDEYWGENERNEKINFTIFKKFSQRIQKHTGNKSYKILNEIREIFNENKKQLQEKKRLYPPRSLEDGISKIYIFGHSLDSTDKDILASFIGDESTSVKVFCKDKGTEGELIANTIKLITEEKLLEKSNHFPSKLEYEVLK